VTRRRCPVCGREMTVTRAGVMRNIPVPHDEWTAMTAEEREQYAEECLETHIANALDSWHNALDSWHRVIGEDD
jgi:hypothetical protein